MDGNNIINNTNGNNTTSSSDSGGILSALNSGESQNSDETWQRRYHDLLKRHRQQQKEVRRIYMWCAHMALFVACMNLSMWMFAPIIVPYLVHSLCEKKRNSWCASAFGRSNTQLHSHIANSRFPSHVNYEYKIRINNRLSCSCQMICGYLNGSGRKGTKHWPQRWKKWNQRTMNSRTRLCKECLSASFVSFNFPSLRSSSSLACDNSLQFRANRQQKVELEVWRRKCSVADEERAMAVVKAASKYENRIANNSNSNHRHHNNNNNSNNNNNE